MSHEDSQLIHPLTTTVINPTTTQNSDAAASLISLPTQTSGVLAKARQCFGSFQGYKKKLGRIMDC